MRNEGLAFIYTIRWRRKKEKVNERDRKTVREKLPEA